MLWLRITTECVSAPMGGGDLFQAKARVLVPAGVKLEGVRGDLEKIAADLMVDIDFQPGGRCCAGRARRR